MEQNKRVWLVTGTSSGLGRALAEIVLEHDEIVVATLRQPSLLDELATKYPQDRLLVLPLDITQPQQVAAVFANIEEKFGRLDVVVNNAGISFVGETEGIDDDQARTVLETNFWGTVSVTKATLKFFREVNPPGAGGRLLQMSSYMGLVGLPPSGYYSASKFALEGISETIVREMDPAWNIKITLIEPGFIVSDIVPKAQTQASESAPHPSYASNPDLPLSKWRRGDVDIEWKDTKRSMELCYKVAGLANPPLHLVIGRDALAAVRAKIAELTKSMDEYEIWSEGLEL